MRSRHLYRERKKKRSLWVIIIFAVRSHEETTEKQIAAYARAKGSNWIKRVKKESK